MKRSTRKKSITIQASIDSAERAEIRQKNHVAAKCFYQTIDMVHKISHLPPVCATNYGDTASHSYRFTVQSAHYRADFQLALRTLSEHIQKLVMLYLCAVENELIDATANDGSSLKKLGLGQKQMSKLTLIAGNVFRRFGLTPHDYFTSVKKPVRREGGDTSPVRIRTPRATVAPAHEVEYVEAVEPEYVEPAPEINAYADPDEEQIEPENKFEQDDEDERPDFGFRSRFDTDFEEMEVGEYAAAQGD